MADCSVCLNEFSAEGPLVPYVLECAHSVCSTCLSSLHTCPICRSLFRRASVKKNFALIESLLRLKTSNEVCSKCKCNVRKNKILICLSCSSKDDSEWMKKQDAQGKCAQFYLCADCVLEDHTSPEHTVEYCGEVQKMIDSWARDSKFEQVSHHVRLILNNLTLSNAFDQYDLLWRLLLTDDQEIVYEVIVDCMFETAIAKPHLCEKLSWICEKLIVKREQVGIRNSFRTRFCEEFVRLMDLRREGWALDSTNNNSELDENLSAKYKKEMLGSINLIAVLLGSGVMNSGYTKWIRAFKQAKFSPMDSLTDKQHFFIRCAAEFAIAYVCNPDTPKTSGEYMECCRFIPEIPQLRQSPVPRIQIAFEKLAVEYAKKSAKADREHFQCPRFI